MPNPAELDSELSHGGHGPDRHERGDRATALGVDFWAVFDSAPDIYLLLAPDPPRFTILAANAARLRATGTRRDDVIGRPLFEAFPDNPDDPEATGVRNLSASLHEVLRTGEPHRMALQKYDLRNAAGEFEERYWDPLNSPVFDDDGHLVYLLHRVEDVTARVLADRRLEMLESAAEETTQRLTRETEARESVEAILSRLRSSEERYRLLADMIPQYIWTTDANGYHGYFSRRWYEFTGASHDDTKGTGWMQYLHPDDVARTTARWQRSLETGEPYSIEYRFRNTKGEYRWFWGQAVPQRNDAGQIVHWFGTLTDISERKQHEEERDQLLAREREAHEEVTTILESVTDAFFAVDDDWRFTYVNGEAERLLKRPRAELLGRCVWDEFPEATGATFEHEYRRAVAEQTTVHFEECYPPLDIWVDVHAYPSHDGLAVFFRDVSRRKRAEEQLRESERNFRALANSIPQLAWMADATGWIFWYNDRWHEYTGTTLEEMQGWGWQKVHHPQYVERVVERIRHSFETGTPWEDTFPLRGRSGEYRWFLSRAVPIRDSDGKVVRWFGTNTDITTEIEAAAERERLLEREREARAEAERQREQLERVTESRTRLMRGFSHDVKNPLGAADGHAQLLEEGILGALTDKQRDSVMRIRRSISTSLRLIHDLLELARAEAGQIEVECVATDVGVAAHEVADDFRAQANAVGLTLQCDTPEGMLAETDPTRLRQILANLLSNAVKYAPKSTVTIATAVRADGGPRTGTWVTASVTDTGPGIPADKQESIFLEFTRLDPEAQPGAGVGLAISRRIAQLLGGDLTVESEVGQGATFTLWLPPARPGRDVPAGAPRPRE